MGLFDFLPTLGEIVDSAMCLVTDHAWVFKKGTIEGEKVSTRVCIVCGKTELLSGG